LAANCRRVGCRARRSAQGKVLEFKRDLSSPDGTLKTLVAIADTWGGILVLGIDGHRHVKGISDPMEAGERLANLIADRIAPTPLPDVEVVPWRDTHVLVVEAYPSPTRLYCLCRLGPEEGVVVLGGSTNRRADAALIEGLRRHGERGIR
jgi:predicted HTH transcriptional regulator